MPAKPYVIAIAGPSCSGKTSVARELAAQISATIFSLDCYYHDLAQLTLEERARFNFDHPESLDIPLLIQHVKELAQGREIQRPVYDFSTHTRTNAIEIMRPSEHLIVEGLFTLHWEELRPLYSTKVFMEATHDVCLPRRQDRDIAERGRTAASVVEQYSKTVQPMADQFIYPSRQFADMVLDGRRPFSESVAAILEHVQASKARQ